MRSAGGSMSLRWTMALAALAALAACARPRAPEPAAASAPSAPMAQAQDEWTPLTWEERHDVMTFAVLPTMARLFQRFEAAKYHEMTCGTCHGADYEDV